MLQLVLAFLIVNYFRDACLVIVTHPICESKIVESDFFGVCVDCIFFILLIRMDFNISYPKKSKCHSNLAQTTIKPLILAILVLTTVILHHCLRKILNLDSKTAVSFASGKRMFSSQIAKDFAFSEIVRNAVFLLDVNWDIVCGIVINATPFVETHVNQMCN